VLSGSDGPGGLFGTAVASAGDVNGDGYGDLIVGAPGVTSSDGNTNGVAYVYLGGPSGLASNPFRLASNDYDEQFALYVIGAGDINGDGYADLVVSETNQSYAYIYFGGPLGPADTADEVLYPIGQLGSINVAAAGDVNGDGYADLITAATDDNQTGTGYLYLGGPTGFPETPSQTLAAPFPSPGSSFGEALAGVGDLNGDGYADVAIAGIDATNSPGVYVYSGDAGGLSSLPGTLRSTGAFNIGAALSGGDVNGDGFSDLLAGGEQTSTEGNALLFLGGSNGISTAPAGTPLTGTTFWFGAAVSVAGDVDGDGYADAIVSDSAAATAGKAYCFRGSSAGLASSASVTFNALDGVTSKFGFSVAMLGPADVTDAPICL
jgi:hypothetical protein